MIHRKNTLKSVLVAIAIGMAGFAAAQSTDGGIAGTATAGETISIKGYNGVQREIQVEETGKFSVRHLPIGTYNVIRIDADGHVVTSQVIDVSVGKTTRMK